MKIISIINHKGGVGKTTITVNVGYALAEAGHRVLIVDLDPQANATLHFSDGSLTPTLYEMLNGEVQAHPTSHENLHLLPSNLELMKAELENRSNVNGYMRLRRVLDKVRGNYDYVLIDCPPSVGWYTQNALNSSDFVLVPVEPSLMSTVGLELIDNLIAEAREFINPNLTLLGYVISNYQGFVVQKHFIQQVKEQYDKPLFDTIIRRYKVVTEATAMQESVLTYQADSNSAEDFKNLANELIQKISIS